MSTISLSLCIQEISTVSHFPFIANCTLLRSIDINDQYKLLHAHNSTRKQRSHRVERRVSTREGRKEKKREKKKERKKERKERSAQVAGEKEKER